MQLSRRGNRNVKAASFCLPALMFRVSTGGQSQAAFLFFSPEIDPLEMSLNGLAATNTPAYLSPDSAPRRPVCEGSPEAGRQVVRQTPQRNESQRQAWFGSWLMYCLTLEQGKTLAVPGLVTLGEAMPKENARNWKC